MEYTDAKALLYFCRVFKSPIVPNFRKSLRDWLQTQLDSRSELSGLLDGVVPDDRDFSADEIVRTMRLVAERIERAAIAELALHGPHCDRMSVLVDGIGIPQGACDALEWLCLARSGNAVERMKNECFENCYALSQRAPLTFRFLAFAIDLPFAELDRWMKTSGVLIESGLVKIDLDGEIHTQDRLETWVAQSAGGMQVSQPSAALLSEPLDATLPISAFADYVPNLEVLRELLRGALARGERRINVLFYGPPGTGKTELAKTLSCSLGVPLHAVGESFISGCEPSRGDRLSQLRFAQRVPLSGAAVLLVDEADDVLTLEEPALFGKRSGVLASTVYLNRLLENSRRPAIWIMNQVQSLDSLIVRRMIFAQAIQPPPRRVRERTKRF